MNESNRKKQTAALWILGILVVILIAIIVGLFIMQAQTRNQEVATKDAKIAQMEQELAQVKEQLKENDIYNKNNQIIESNQTNTITSNTTMESDKYINSTGKEYEIDLTNAKKGDKIKQVIDNNYIVYLDVDDEREGLLSWKLSVNGGETIFEDAIYQNSANRKIKVFTLGKYIFYINNNYSDIRNKKLLVINVKGELIKEIYELDNSNQGMVLSDFTFLDNSLIINASRLSHGGAVIAKAYGNTQQDSFDIENFTKIPQDMAVKSKYSYKVETDGSIDFENPTEEKSQTFRNYLESNEEYIVSKSSSKDTKERIEDYLK